MTRNVAFILFPGAEELDFAGPWEVYTMTNAIVPDAVRAYVVSEDGGTVACAKGMRVEADYSFANAPKADVAVVPGGLATRQEVDNPAIIEFIRAQDATSELTTSVCTGALLLERAGLLAGLKATTHWLAIDELKAKPGVEVLENTRWVDNGKVITSSGVSAGIDAALYAVGRLWGEDTARRVQRAMEYDPAPPYQQR
jgi:transcriptional regulator GlxA family with amidase domain